MKLYSDNFKLLENNKLLDIKDFPNVKFDLIIAIQSLYYLNKIDLNKTLITMKKLLKPNGVVFFTMISKKNEYYKKYSNKKPIMMDLL
jgi:cyclopropane fatty-acyl-phospholipid synthase-like methyltransferase